MTGTSLVPLEWVERTIFILRGRRVILDSDLAAPYGVSVGIFNRAVKRNAARFPPDFVFQLTHEENEALRFQIGISNAGRGGRRYLPYAFTEHGAVMLASVLNSKVAVEASIQVVRAFIRIRTILAAHKELAGKLEELERKYDARFKVVFEAIRRLMRPELPEPPRRPIGFLGEGRSDDPRSRLPPCPPHSRPGAAGRGSSEILKSSGNNIRWAGSISPAPSGEVFH